MLWQVCNEDRRNRRQTNAPHYFLCDFYVRLWGVSLLEMCHVYLGRSSQAVSGKEDNGY